MRRALEAIELALPAVRYSRALGSGGVRKRGASELRHGRLRRHQAATHLVLEVLEQPQREQ